MWDKALLWGKISMPRLTRKLLEERLFELKKEELKEIARMFALSVSGTKEDLVNTIISKTKASELAKVLNIKIQTKPKKGKQKAVK